MSAFDKPWRAERVQKTDAARRQLATAIDLWFHDGDTVAIHSLAYAAYEVLHTLSRKAGRTRDLLFDTLMIKDEYRAEWALRLKRAPNFFKHANRDEPEVEFFPKASEMFILFSILAIETMGLKKSHQESAYLYWVMFHEPRLLTPLGKKDLEEKIPVEGINAIRALPKAAFFDVFMRVAGKGGIRIER